MKKTTKKKTTTKKATQKTTAKKAATKKKVTAKKATTKTAAKVKKAPPKRSAVPARAALQVGTVLPNFELASTGGKTVSLAALKGKFVVLYFYPRDMTPGCTLEGHDFSKLLPEFNKAGAEVFGVSRDSIQSHEKFKEKEKYALDLLSDEDEDLCSKLSVIKMKNMYGKQVRGIERSTFVISRDGTLLKEWRGVKVEGHASEVLAYIQQNSN